jgi:hypothetical protein
MLRVLHHMTRTYYSTHAAAQSIANACGLDDPAWSYVVHQNTRGFYISIFDEDDHYVGTL